MTKLFLGRSCCIELSDSTLPDYSAEVIDLGAKLCKHRADKNLILRNSKRPGGLHHHMNMSRWFGMHELIGQFLGHSRHQVPMLAKKMNMLVIGCRLQGIDLDRIGGPVFEK